jgi:hypothetical protein
MLITHDAIYLRAFGRADVCVCVCGYCGLDSLCLFLFSFGGYDTCLLHVGHRRFTQAINVLNGALKDSAEEWPWVTFVDCSVEFLAQVPPILPACHYTQVGGLRLVGSLAVLRVCSRQDSVLQSKRSLERALMPDGLHPNDLGSAKWAECMLPTIREHMSTGQQ